MSSPGPGATALGGAEGRRRVASLNLVFAYANLAVTFATGVVLVPAYLRAFSLATYGAWLASGNLLGMVGVLDAGVNLVFSQRLASVAARGDRSGFARTAGAGVALILTSGLLVALIGFSIAPWIPGWVHCPVEDAARLRLGVQLAALGSGASLVAQGLGGVLQAWEAPRAAGVSNLTANVLGLGAIVCGLALGWGVAALACGAFTRGVAGALLSGAFVSIRWRRERLEAPRLERAAAIELLRASAPVFASRIGAALLANSESLVLAVVATPALAGVVALTGRIHTFAALLLAPIGASAFSGVARLAATDRGPRVRAILGELFGVAGAASALLLGGAVAVNPGFVRLWVGPDAFGGLRLSLALALGVALSSRTALANLTLTALGRPLGAAAAALAEALARLALMLVLVRWVGGIGIPSATIAATLGVSGVIYAVLFQQALGPRGGAIVASGALGVALSLAVGVAISAWWRPTSWAAWTAQGALAAVAVSALLLAASGPARSTLTSTLARWRATPGSPT